MGAVALPGTQDQLAVATDARQPLRTLSGASELIGPDKGAGVVGDGDEAAHTADGASRV